MSLCLLMSLTLSACSTVPKTELTPVPEGYLLPTAQPPLYAAGPVLLNSELAQGLLDAREALRSCNADKAALRQWNLTVKEHNATQ